MYRGMASIDSSDSIDSIESSDLPDDIDEDCWPPVEDSDDESLPGDIDDDGLPDDVHNDDLADQLIGSDGGGNLMDTDESHDVVEVFSIPRLVPVGRESGLVCEWSFDLETGHDLTFEKHRRFMWETIQKVKPRVAVVSPPCTFYSAANRVWNKNRYSVEEWERRHVAANVLLALAMQICKYQHDHKAGFIFEHPSGASSWSEPDVEFVRQLPDVRKVIFDACAVGAVTKVDRFPVKKSTALLTNIPEVVAKFETQKCRCPVQMIDGKMQRHRAIMGFEGGVSRSRFAQIYPPPMVRLLVAAIVTYVS